MGVSGADGADNLPRPSPAIQRSGPATLKPEFAEGSELRTSRPTPLGGGQPRGARRRTTARFRGTPQRPCSSLPSPNTTSCRPVRNRTLCHARDWSARRKRITIGTPKTRCQKLCKNIQCPLVTDNRTPEVRSRIMASVGHKNTGTRNGGQATAPPPGTPLRPAPARPARATGHRIRTAAQSGLGPRLLLGHGHDCRKGRLPTSRVAYWSEKIDKNRARDASNVADLKSRGWTVCVVWECEIPDAYSLADRLVRFLDGDRA